jgi:hypothetical protein
MKTCPLVRASIGVAVCVVGVGVIVACTRPAPDSSSSSSAAIERAADGGRDVDAACPATSVQIECGRACAGDGPVRPLLEQLMVCQGCTGGITRDGTCLDTFLDACEPLGDPCIDFVNCVTDSCK